MKKILIIVPFLLFSFLDLFSQPELVQIIGPDEIRVGQPTEYRYSKHTGGYRMGSVIRWNLDPDQFGKLEILRKGLPSDPKTSVLFTPNSVGFVKLTGYGPDLTWAEKWIRVVPNSQKTENGGRNPNGRNPSSSIK